MLDRVVIIDGDILAYQIAAKEEKPIHWGDGFWTLHVEQGPAEVALEERVLNLQDAVEADKVIIALSDDDHNFRKDVYPAYKSNRVDKRKPMLLPVLKAFLMEEFDTFRRPGLEGDDVQGILATSKVIVKAKERIIASLDKDMKTIPGLFYNFGKPEKGIVEISEDEADYWHLIQTLTGDTTDGYPGCPGIGPVKAEKLLAEHFDVSDDGIFMTTSLGEAWATVVAAFEKAKLGEEEALTQARVARILRASDYDFKNRRPILWKP
jgi:DNA polymerase-1